MSHVVKIQTKIHDPKAVFAACERLHLPTPAVKTVELFSESVTGLAVNLPDWLFPVVVDTLTGSIRFDNYGGRWGKQDELNGFLQAYAVEKTRLEARKQGHTIHEQTLDDGSIRLQVFEGQAPTEDAQGGVLSRIGGWLRDAFA